MSTQPVTFTVRSVKDEAKDIRLLALAGEQAWDFVPGQVAILGMEGLGESYFAIASAPEDKGALEFLIRKGAGVAEALFAAKLGTPVQAKGPLGRGFPIDRHKGRDLILAGVGTAIAPLRSVLNSVCHRRRDFGKIALVYGVRLPEELCFAADREKWQMLGIEVILTVSRPEGTGWQGRTGHVQAHFEEAMRGLSRPVALICGMKEMMEQSRQALAGLGVAAGEVLTNF